MKIIELLKKEPKWPEIPNDWQCTHEFKLKSSEAIEISTFPLFIPGCWKPQFPKMVKIDLAEPSAPEHEGYRSCWKSASFENLRDKVLLVTDVCITVIEFEKIHVIGNWWNHLDIFHWYYILYWILSVWKQWWHPCLSSLNWACQLKHWNWYTQFTSPASNPMQPINKY